MVISHVIKASVVKSNVYYEDTVKYYKATVTNRMQKRG